MLISEAIKELQSILDEHGDGPLIRDEWDDYDSTTNVNGFTPFTYIDSGTLAYVEVDPGKSFEKHMWKAP